MALFKKKERVIDLSERYHQQQEKLADMRSDIAEAKTEQSSGNDSGGMGFFGMFGGGNSTPSTSYSNSGSSEEISPEEKKRRLSKRLLDMTNKIEDLTNQIYHLQQRIEVLERKNNSHLEY